MEFPTLAVCIPKPQCRPGLCVGREIRHDQRIDCKLQASGLRGGGALDSPDAELHLPDSMPETVLMRSMGWPEHEINRDGSLKERRDAGWESRIKNLNLMVRSGTDNRLLTSSRAHPRDAPFGFLTCTSTRQFKSSIFFSGPAVASPGYKDSTPLAPNQTGHRLT